MAIFIAKARRHQVWDLLETTLVIRRLKKSLSKEIKETNTMHILLRDDLTSAY